MALSSTDHVVTGISDFGNGPDAAQMRKAPGYRALRETQRLRRSVNAAQQPHFTSSLDRRLAELFAIDARTASPKGIPRPTPDVSSGSQVAFTGTPTHLTS